MKYVNRGFDNLCSCVEYCRGNRSLAVPIYIRASSTQGNGVDAFKGIFPSRKSKLYHVQWLLCLAHIYFRRDLTPPTHQRPRNHCLAKSIVHHHHP